MEKKQVNSNTLYGVKVGEAIMTMTEPEFDRYTKALEKEKIKVDKKNVKK